MNSIWTSVGGTLGATDSSNPVTLFPRGLPVVGVEITGTFVQNLIVEEVIAGSGWVTAQAFTAANVSASASPTAPVRLFVQAAGRTAIRVRQTAYTSGTATVVLTAGFGAIGAAGGGGGGASTIADGADVALGTTTDAGIITDIAGTGIGFLRGLIKQSLTLLARLPAALTGSGNLKAALVESTATVTTTTANLDVALSTRTKPADQQHAIVDSSALPTGASTETTLALIKAKTDNLDVALSTRTKPADAQHTIVDSGAVTSSSTLQAGTAAAGNVGGLTKTISSILTRPANTTTYTANDEMTDTGGAIRTLTGAGTVSGGKGIITHCLLSCSSNGATKPTFTVYVYDTTSTPASDNAAFAPSDGVQDTCIGSFTLTSAEVGDATASSGNFTMDAGQIHLPYTTVGGADLFFRVKVTNGYTPGTNSDTNTFRFKVQQDAN